MPPARPSEQSVILLSISGLWKSQCGTAMSSLGFDSQSHRGAEYSQLAQLASTQRWPNLLICAAFLISTRILMHLIMYHSLSRGQKPVRPGDDHREVQDACTQLQQIQTSLWWKTELISSFVLKRKTSGMDFFMKTEKWVWKQTWHQEKVYGKENSWEKTQRLTQES